LPADDAVRSGELQEKFEYHCASTNQRIAEHSKMKRKYGSALARESEAEKAQRLRAKEMRDNTHNYGSASRKGAISRGKKRGKAYRAGS
jgi:hypothetical protein